MSEQITACGAKALAGLSLATALRQSALNNPKVLELSKPAIAEYASLKSVIEENHFPARGSMSILTRWPLCLTADSLLQSFTRASWRLIVFGDSNPYPDGLVMVSSGYG